MITVTPGDLPGVLRIQLQRHTDARGFFFEAYNEREFEAHSGVSARFVQDNFSHSVRNVVRGFHYQVRRPQGKLVSVVSGDIHDVVVDVRKDSPTLGQWSSTRLAAHDGVALWIPPGYAHGFLVLSETALVLYKATDYWQPALERAIAWNDSELGVRWPLDGRPIVSAKDAHACTFREAELIE